MVALCHLWSLGLYEFYFCNSKDCFMNLLAILGIGISLKESLNLDKGALFEHINCGGIILLNPSLHVKDRRLLYFLVTLLLCSSERETETCYAGFLEVLNFCVVYYET